MGPFWIQLNFHCAYKGNYSRGAFRDHGPHMECLLPFPQVKENKRLGMEHIGNVYYQFLKQREKWLGLHHEILHVGFKKIVLNNLETL